MGARGSAPDPFQYLAIGARFMRRVKHIGYKNCYFPNSAAAADRLRTASYASNADFSRTPA